MTKILATVLTSLVVFLSASNISSTAPSNADTSGGNASFTEVQVGSHSACALSEEGDVTCWGKLWGNQAPPNFGPIKRLGIVGDEYACVVSSGDELKCWWNKKISEWNWFYNSRNKYTKSPGVIHLIPKDLGQIKQIASSTAGTSACVVKLDETVRCWGAAGRVPANLGKVKKLQEFSGGYCALGQNSYLTCWGTSFWNKHGLLSSGGILQYSGGFEVSFDSTQDTVDDFASGGWNICVKRTGKNLPSFFCLSSAGVNAFNISDVPFSQESSGMVDVISVGASGACVISSSAVLTCWGESQSIANTPGSDQGFRQVSSGDFVYCAVTGDTKINCWGDSKRIAGDLKFGIPQPYPAPETLIAPEIGTTGFEFRWKRIENNTTVGSPDFEIRPAGKKWTRMQSSNLGSLRSITGLKPNTAYEFRMRIKNKAGYSKYSEIASVKTASKCPTTIAKEIFTSKAETLKREKLMKLMQKELEQAWKKTNVARNELKKYKDYSNLPSVKVLQRLRDQYEEKLVKALNSGDVGLAVQMERSSQDLGRKISNLLGYYPVAERELQAAESRHLQSMMTRDLAKEKLDLARVKESFITNKCSVR